MAKFNVILFCGTSEKDTKTRNYGVARLATHIRECGYTCLVVNFSDELNWSNFIDILDLTMDKNTYMVGLSCTFLPLRVVPLNSEQNFYQEYDSLYGQIKKVSNESKNTTTLINDLIHNKIDPWLNEIRKRNPKTKITCGGTAIASYLDIKNIDNFFYGLSENMVIDYLNSLSGKGPKRIFNKVLDYDYKSQNSDWDFRSSKTTYSDYDFVTPNETLSLETSRGCRFSCSFCAFPMIGQKNLDDYIKFEECLKSELIENYNKWGTTQYWIVDDTFNDTTEKLIRVKRVFDSLPFKIKFWCYARIDIIAAHTEQIQLLKDMGLEEVFFGVETFHHKAGKTIGKGMKPEKIKQALAKCKKVWGDSVFITAGIIVGLPYEPESSILETVEYLSDPNCPIHAAWLHQLNIHDSKNPDPRIKYVYKSEYDRNYDKYGYYFESTEIDIMNFTRWRKKDDGSGINSYEQALEISNRGNAIIPHKLTFDFYLHSLDHPVLSNRELCQKMGLEEYYKVRSAIDQTKLYKETIKNQYFDPLLKKLKNEG